MQKASRLAATLFARSSAFPRAEYRCQLLDARVVWSQFKYYCAPILLSRFSASAAQSAAELEGKLTVIAMPQLSPHMVSGYVRKWLKKPGDAIATYDVVMEVNTDTLSEEAYKVGDFAGTVTMLVEAQEDGFLSRILVDEGQDVGVHTPVATMCEFEEDLEELAKNHAEVDKILEQSQSLRQMTWQSYLKEAKNGSKGCS